MGTTLVGAIVVGGDIVFAHAGDSRAYMVRDGIAMQLTEDHTLLARLLAAGVDVDTSNEGARFKSMLTNALGIGHECKVSTFVVPVADGDRFLLCSDGITEYVGEAEIGEVLTTQPSPARSAQRLVELALQRGGGDNATALVVRVLEAGETARPAELLHRDDKAINACPLWAKVSPQQRLRALRIALARDHVVGERIPAHSMGDRVAWILVEGEVNEDGIPRGPGTLLYPEALLADAPLPEKAALAVPTTEVRALAIRADDFREICEDDSELGEVLLEALGAEIAARRPGARPRVVVQASAEGRGPTDPGDIAHAVTDPNMKAVRLPTNDETAPTIPPNTVLRPPGTLPPPMIGRTPTPKPTDSARAPTVPQVGRTPTRPPGDATEPVVGRKPTLQLPQVGRAPTPPPDEDPARGPTVPAMAIPRLHPRGSTPPSERSERLIVPKAERADADAQLDRALSELTVDRTWAELPDEDGDATRPAPRIPHRPGTEEPEITVESVSVETKAETEGEPEISIERVVEIEAEAPLNEPNEIDQTAEVTMTVDDNSARITEHIKETSSQTITLTVTEPAPPEILVVKPGRPITADDTKLVAGSIDSDPAPKRAKRQTDAPD